MGKVSGKLTVYFDEPAVETVVKKVKKNPKRMQRDVKKQLQDTGIGIW